MTKQDISICIITKNECEKLEKCLKNASFLGFETVVVDTGSSDDTIDMASKYTDSIYHFKWIDDFAAAKNYAAKMARNNLVMILDSDEYICHMSENEIQDFLKLVEVHKNDVGRLHRLNDVNQSGKLTKYYDWTNRIFDRNKYCFSGCIHEQIVRGSVFDGPSGDDAIYSTYLTNINLNHDGYVGSKEMIKAKAERNANLLLKELESRPDDTYVLYQTGKAYFMMEDYDKAVIFLGKALEHEVEPYLEYVIDLVESYGYALIETGNAHTAVLLESVEKEFGNSADFRFMMGLAYMNDAQFDKAVDSFIQATELKNAKMQGVDSYLAWYNAGVIKECMGDIEDAVSYYKKCEKYEEAEIRLREIMPINN